jgi:hypothetical protein
MWYPGYIINYLMRPVRQLIPAPWLTFRVLADIQRFDLMNSDSLELMRSIAYVFGVIAFWEMAPGVLLYMTPLVLRCPFPSFEARLVSNMWTKKFQTNRYVCS